MFINNLLDKTPYDAFFKLQGSNDQSAWTDIYTFDNDLHEGWNSIVAPTDSPYSYNTFRFYGEKSGSCRVGEVKLIGLQVLDDSNTSISCTAKLTLHGETTDLSSVSYTTSKTATIDSIEPRYGSEIGGETVTFNGSGFSGTPTVMIDDRPCTVISSSDVRIRCTTSSRTVS